jgi:hypothetical protein
MSDYHALAQRVRDGIKGIRGCLLLSRDGMVLGSDPEGDAEVTLKTAWLRFAALGEADRSYVEFPDQLWAFVRRGGYAAFVLADAGVRAGVLIDLLEQVLMAGEVERIHEREALRLPEAPGAPSGKPRTSFHKPETRQLPQPQPQPVVAGEIRVVASAPEVAETARSDDEQLSIPADAGDSASSEAPTPERPTDDDGAEVDRILLAKEFAGLLQVPRDDDEATR